MSRTDPGAVLATIPEDLCLTLREFDIWSQLPAGWQLLGVELVLPAPNSYGLTRCHVQGTSVGEEQR